MQREGTREATLQVNRQFVHLLAACISEQTSQHQRLFSPAPPMALPSHSNLYRAVFTMFCHIGKLKLRYTRFQKNQICAVRQQPKRQARRRLCSTSTNHLKLQNHKKRNMCQETLYRTTRPQGRADLL